MASTAANILRCVRYESSGLMQLPVGRWSSAVQTVANSRATSGDVSQVFQKERLDVVIRCAFEELSNVHRDDGTTGINVGPRVRDV